jgi:hydroxymethylbilane synthase
MKLGVRRSKLAMAYAQKVIDALPFPEIEIIPIVTEADVKHDQPINEMGGKGVFVSEIEKHLIDKKIDIAVHSFKDLPADMDDRLEISAVLERSDPRDCFIGKLFPGAKVGTGSPRRIAQLEKNFNVEFNVRPIRGNIDTRIKKLENKEYDAIILAVAGLETLGLQNKISKILPLEKMLPCVGQGVIAVQTRKELPYPNIMKSVNHMPTYYSVMAERELLKTIDGDCHTAVGVISSVVGDCIILQATNYENDKHYTTIGKKKDYINIGQEVGNQIK